MADFRQLWTEAWEARRLPTPTAGVPAARTASPHQRLRRRVFDRVLRDLEDGGAVSDVDPGLVRQRVAAALATVQTEPGRVPLQERESERLTREVIAEIGGLGPLAPLFEDPTISDILVNGPHQVWVDRFGRLERTAVRFDDERHLRRLLERLVAAQGRHLDEASPSVDVRLADGSRLHALLPPLAASPVISVRRMRPSPFRLDDLQGCGTLDDEMAEFLRGCVVGGRNMVISGGAASGKTTLLSTLARFIPHAERVVTIEETAELVLDHPHVVSLEARLANIEGRGEVTLRELVRGALRMRPDRIIVGEVRGGEVFDMLQAMNTGHQGSLTTVHANNPEDALRRLENLVLLSGFEMPSRSIRELLAAAFDAIVQTTRFLDGSRRVTSIREVGWSGDGLVTSEIFRWDEASGRHLRVASSAFDDAPGTDPGVSW